MKMKRNRKEKETKILELIFRNKSQAALEFLMTYGWAILVVLIAIAALAYFGVLSPDKFIPTRCVLEQGIGCMDFKINENSVTLVLINGKGEDITISSIKVRDCTGTDSGLLGNRQQITFVVDGCSNTVNEKFIGDLNITYTGETGLTHKNKGNVVGKVESGVSDGGGGEGPLDEAASQNTACINCNLPHGSEARNKDIILELHNIMPYDVYLESFTLSWTDPGNLLNHIQHRTPDNEWEKPKIWDSGDLPSPASGTFILEPDNLIIPANSNTEIDDLHFTNDIVSGTQFTLTLDFNDESSSTLSFTIG